MMMRNIYQFWAFLAVILFSHHSKAQNTMIALTADRVFDGFEILKNMTILIEGETIKAFGSENEIDFPEGTLHIELEGTTLMPGMIEGHSHILLHPYNETSWNDQVLIESEAERVTRAVVHAKRTLLAGFTTIRDLGSEGAGYADVGVKTSIQKGIIPGPHMLVAGKAIVATGSYGPKGFVEDAAFPLGAEEADGVDHLIRVVRDQIGKGADMIKVYADYRWGPGGEAMPTFSLAELQLIVETAASSGRQVVAHASTQEGMKRATLAGVATIEHGDEGTMEIFNLMKKHDVAFCPTLAAGDAILQYRGWNKKNDPEPPRIIQKRASFAHALAAGVKIVAGGDVGVFTHGTNARELEMMVEYGMSSIETLRAVTSVNANVFRLSETTGRIKEGLRADIIAVAGNPVQNIANLRNVKFVMKNGKIYKKP